MAKKSRSLTASELLEGLHEDSLSTVVPTTLTGMVKKPTGKDRAIQFAAAGDCSKWVAIPLEMIEEAEVLQTVACRDHSHPVVRLTLKLPKAPEARVFAALLDAMQSAVDGAQQALAAARPQTDQWGDPICGRGMRKVCGPANCPSPWGGGTIGCTKCWCEPIPNRHPEGLVSYDR